MTYEEWLNIIDELKKTNNVEQINILKNTHINENLSHMIETKLSNLVKEKFEKSISKIIRELPTIFSDVNYLDLTLINLKKEINFIKEIIQLKQISISEQNNLLNLIKEQTENTYNILLKEANQTDQTGIYTITINNNRIKWSEENELQRN